MSIGVVGIGLTHEDNNLAARIRRPRSKPFVTVDEVAITIALDARLDVGGVTGRHRRLGHGERRTDLAFQQRREPLPFLFVAAVARQHFHVARVGRRAVERFRRKR